MTAIETSEAPKAVGPYSQARTHAGLLFVSGQLPINPATGKVESEDSVDQVRQCLRNISAIAEAAGATMGNVLKTTVLLTRLSEFARVNQAYAEFFVSPFPARATFEVSALPLGASVEIEAVIALGS